MNCRRSIAVGKSKKSSDNYLLIFKDYNYERGFNRNNDYKD
jgi:hypothetical protein